MCWTRPTFNSQINNVANIIVKPLQYIFRELSDHIHMISKCMYEEFFIKYNSKLTAMKWKMTRKHIKDLKHLKAQGEMVNNETFCIMIKAALLSNSFSSIIAPRTVNNPIW